MKNLKKLSVVLMITTLFSASFTSCIDNEVSPVVEAIYEAQADLIAAQSAVQNAQASFISAQADNEQAQAALLLAQADAAAALAQGELAVMLAQAGLTDAQAALVMAQSASLADLTAAQVAALIAEAGLTDAQAALIIAQAAVAMAEAGSIETLAQGELALLLAQAGLLDAESAQTMANAQLVSAQAARLALLAEGELAKLLSEAGLTDAEAAAIATLSQGELAVLLASAGLMDAEAAEIAALTPGELAVLLAEAEVDLASAMHISALAMQIEMLTPGQLAKLMAEAGFTQAQADRMAALTPGELAVMMANAGYDEALALQIMEAIEVSKAERDYNFAKRVHELELLAAKTERLVAAEQYKMDLAEQQFIIDMNDLLAELAEQGAVLAKEYAAEYTMAQLKVNQLKVVKSQVESFIASQQLILDNKEFMTPAAIASIEMAIATENAKIEAATAAIADFQAILDDPASLEVRVVEVKAEFDVLKARNAEILIEQAYIENEIEDLYAEYNAIDAMYIEYNAKNGFLIDRQNEWDALTLENTQLAARIVEIEDILANYAASQLAFETALTDAQAILDTKQGEYDAAIMATVDAEALIVTERRARNEITNGPLAEAQQDLVEAEAARDLVLSDIAALDNNYRQAIRAYEDAVQNCEDNLPGLEANVVTDQGILDNHLADVAVLLAAYNAAEEVFTLDPNGVTWFPGDDGLFGADPDDGLRTYVRVRRAFNWGAAVGTSDISLGADYRFGTFQRLFATKGDLNAVLGIGNGNIHNNYTQLDAENAAAASEADVIDDWYDIENDDFSRRNEQLLLQAEAALDAANALTQGYIDALENSTTLRDELCDDIPALEADYLYKRDLFEDASIHLDPAEAAVTAAEDEVGVQEAAVAAAQVLVDAAKEARDLAVIAEEEARVARNQARRDRNDADADLTDFLNTTEQQWQNRIDARQATIDANDILLAELEILIAKATSEVAELQDAFDAAEATPYRAQLLVDIYSKYDESWALDAEDAANDVRMNQLREIAIAMFGSINDVVTADDIAESIATKQGEIATAQAELLRQQDLLSIAENNEAAVIVEIERFIELSEVKIASLNTEIAAWEAISMKYSDLLADQLN